MFLILQTDPENWREVIEKTCEPYSDEWRVKPYGEWCVNSDWWRVKPGSAGLDIPCPMNLTIPPGQKGFKIHLGVRVKSSWHFWLVPRSSISKTSLRMSNSVGLIDIDYRGELIMVVDNIKPRAVNVLKGTRLCQIVSMSGQKLMFRFGSVLNDTERGEGGFGSTS